MTRLLNVHRVRLLKDHLATREDILLAGRVFVWSLALRVLKHIVPLDELATLMWVDKPGGDRRPRREQQIATFVRWAERLKLARCLERSLTAYRLLSEGNAHPTLVVGVRRSACAVEGHTWVVVDGMPLNESGESLKGLSPVVAFGPGGAALHQPGSRDCQGASMPAEVTS